MIELRKGNLFECDAAAWVNPVNTVGTMGKGLAREFKKRFPAMVKHYRHACDTAAFTIGKVQVWENQYEFRPPALVINFPTKSDWRYPSRIEWIDAGLDALVRKSREWHIASVAVPALGCGEGGLSWSEVLPLMRQYFRNTRTHWIIFEPVH